MKEATNITEDTVPTSCEYSLSNKLKPAHQGKMRPLSSMSSYQSSSRMNVLFVLLLVLTFMTHQHVQVTAAPTSTGPQSCDLEVRGMLNSAFVFIKPHANTAATQALVVDKLAKAGITILSQIDISGEEIDKKGLIDQHYYSIASKATILGPEEIPVPQDKFNEAFGETWETVLSDKRACNAMQACERFQCSPLELNEAWRKAKAVKFGGGFYCGMFLSMYIYSLCVS
jgi:hypothetical protein